MNSYFFQLISFSKHLRKFSIEKDNIDCTKKLKEIDIDNIELSIVIKKKLKEIDKDNIELLIVIKKEIEGN